MANEDIKEILCEESELENEMVLSTAKGYETLLNDWMLQIKSSLETSCEKAIEHDRNFRVSRGPHQVTFTILPFL